MAITQLSLTGTPGRRYSFSAKSGAAPPTPKGVGLMTELSVLALPGMRHTFSTKGVAPTPTPVPTPAPVGPTGAGGGGGGIIAAQRWREEYPRRKKIDQLDKDDKEIMELAAIIVQSGILD